MSDAEELFMKKQTDAILEVRKLLGEKSVKNDGDIMGMLELTFDNEGNYNPQQAYNLLVSRPTTPIGLKTNKTHKKTPLSSINPFTNRGTFNNNLTRRNITRAINSDKIITDEQTTEKHTLESQLPDYLNGANVDIIKRDGHCFFRSITHQLVDYGFTVDHEYQVVRNLIADYIYEDPEITDIIIHSESPGYSDKQAYTNAIKQSLWGGRFEIQAIHDGCLSSLTDGQAFKIIVYSVKPDGTIGLHPDFLHTMPNGDEEQLITRWPIRLLFVGNNHFHRIYFEDLVRQKQNYMEETRNIGPNTGLPPSRPITAQLKQMGLLESSPRPNELDCQACTTRNDISSPICRICETNRVKPEDWICLVCSAYNSKSDEICDQCDAPRGQTAKEAEAYNLLKTEQIIQPFFIMGYQNGKVNKYYKHIFKKTPPNNYIYECDIYVPRNPDSNRKPIESMGDMTHKTVVNLSLHYWALRRDAERYDENGNQVNQKNLDMYIKSQKGLVPISGEGFFPISFNVATPIPYLMHHNSFSPDTGVIVLDDNEDNPTCTIYVTDPTDSRQLILVLHFHRQELKPGGKSRRRNTRKPRRNQRRRTKRR